MTWLTTPASTDGGSSPEPVTTPSSGRTNVGEYRPLEKYLDERFADTVVLRFGEIEDLVGFALPEEARVELTWWATAEAGGAQSVQSRAWVRANRSAVANMNAQTVMFERLPA